MFDKCDIILQSLQVDIKTENDSEWLDNCDEAGITLDSLLGYVKHALQGSLLTSQTIELFVSCV